MALETFSPAAEKSRDHAVLARLQLEAAQTSATIGGFRSTFRMGIENALATGQVHASSTQEHFAMLNDLSDHNAIHIAAAPDEHVLGWNTIGGGDKGIHLNHTMLATLPSSDADVVDHTVAHEAAHGEQVRLHGELEIDGKIIDPLLLYEGHAEVIANSAVGMSMTEHREGQPEEVYAEGQRLAVDIIRQAGRSAFEEVMTRTGDLRELQGVMVG